MVMVYVLVAQFSAVTVTVLTFLPIERFFDPPTETVAAESCGVALMVHTLTSSPTFTVYDVLEGEKEGERLPAETLRLERFALLEAEDDGFVTETVVLLEETLKGFPS